MSNGIARGRMSECAVGGLIAAGQLAHARGGQLGGSIDPARAAPQRSEVEGSSSASSVRVWPERTKREHGRRASAQAVAAPATVSGEPSAEKDHWATGKVGKKATTREPGDLPSAVPELTLERGCSDVFGHPWGAPPKALTRDQGQSASEGSMSVIAATKPASSRAKSARARFKAVHTRFKTAPRRFAMRRPPPR